MPPPPGHDAPFVPRRRDLRRRFDRAAASFDGADFVHRAGAAGLLERIAPIRLAPQRILELGSATGTLSRELAKRYRGSRVTSLDLSLPMLREARRRRWPWARVRELQASADAIPLATGSMDLVVANMLLPWIADGPALFAEIARVLREDGLFAFAAPGPDSLRELREAFAGDDYAHVANFVDLHDVGDALVRAGLRDPVLDVDRLDVSYDSAAKLFRDLTACGGRNALAGRRRSLAGRERFRRACEALESAGDGGPFRISLEMTYGHAFGGQPRTAAGEFRVSLDALRRTRR